MCALLRDEVLVAASNERGCISRDLCCGISYYPSRLGSTVDHPPCHGVSHVTKLLHLELHPHHIVCRHYSRVGLILLSSARTHSAGSIRGQEEINEIQYSARWRKSVICSTARLRTYIALMNVRNQRASFQHRFGEVGVVFMDLESSHGKHL